MAWLPERESRPKLTKQEFREQSRELRKELLASQTRLRKQKVPTILLVAGVDGAGKGDTVSLLSQWLDPRWIRTRAFDDPTDEERERPDYWRYWRALPARGRTALFLSAWYSPPLLERVNGNGNGRTSLEAPLARIRDFERMLAVDGHVMLKIWLHLDQEAQVRRFREFEADPAQRWRVTPQDWHHCSRYTQFAEAAEEMMEQTHTPESPWVVIDSEDPRRRNLALGRAVHEAFSQAPANVEEIVAEEPPAPNPPRIESAPSPPPDKPTYSRELSRLQGRLNHLHRHARKAGVSLIGVFEGRDAAGKGGAIRRVLPAFDPRCVDVIRVGPPTEEEQAHHYLWRFWRRVPRAGHVALFDRSWYGRVLVERVEGLTKERLWRLAYAEIAAFERELVESGIVLAKFWLDISWEEQKRRFAERKRVSHKRWKLTKDDVRNRGFWKDYDTAIEEALARTHTDVAPWTFVPADDKRHARLRVLETLTERLEQGLDVAASAAEAG